jgi:16S rRNA processing protein RimM
MNKKILIAKVISVFGIKGEVKIIVYSNDPLKIDGYDLFDSKDNKIVLKINNKAKNSFKTNGAGDAILIAKIVGIEDRNAAEKLKNFEIFIERDAMVKTNKDEFYYVDLIGLDVIDLNSKIIGKVLNVANYGAGGVIEIEFDNNSIPKNYGKIENFSFKNAIFPEVDLLKNFIRIDVPIITEIKKS